MHQQPGGGRFAATGFADNADGLALADRKRHVIDRTHGFAFAEQPAAHGEMLGQAIDAQQRLRLAADVLDGIEFDHFGHDFDHGQLRISMALRRPSLSRLKQIETAKIIAPGSAATQGLT